MSHSFRDRRGRTLISAGRRVKRRVRLAVMSSCSPASLEHHSPHSCHEPLVLPGIVLSLPLTSSSLCFSPSSDNSLHAGEDDRRQKECRSFAPPTRSAEVYPACLSSTSPVPLSIPRGPRKAVLSKALRQPSSHSTLHREDVSAIQHGTRLRL